MRCQRAAVFPEEQGLANKAPVPSPDNFLAGGNSGGPNLASTLPRDRARSPGPHRIAALGLTVALFVAAEAFVDPGLQGQAKMGALFSGLVGIVAVVLGRLFGLATSEPRREV